MTLCVHDTAQKLRVLDDLATRARLLLDNVNQKYRHKRIELDREHGFVAKSGSGQLLPLGSLSSGEQQELVLHYDLLFRVRSNTIVLLDEPELSLHVAWQKRFLPDLLKIVQLSNFDALVATHSPYVVGDRTDLMTGLGVFSSMPCGYKDPGSIAAEVMMTRMVHGGAFLVVEGVTDMRLGAALLRWRPNQSLRRRRGRRQLDPSRRGEERRRVRWPTVLLSSATDGGLPLVLARFVRGLSTHQGSGCPRRLRTAATAAKCHRAPVDSHRVADQMPTGPSMSRRRAPHAASPLPRG